MMHTLTFRRIRRVAGAPALAAALLGATLGACSSSDPVTAPQSGAPTLTFSAADVRTVGRPSSTGAETTGPKLVIKDIITTPDICQDVSARLNVVQAEARIEVVVTARQQPVQVCAQQVGQFVYQVEVAPLQSRAYRLVVRHVLQSPQGGVQQDSEVRNEIITVGGGS
jgi:hypothetical protein